jgi:hypothetical protein
MSELSDDELAALIRSAAETGEVPAGALMLTTSLRRRPAVVVSVAAAIAVLAVAVTVLTHVAGFRSDSDHGSENQRLRVTTDPRGGGSSPGGSTGDNFGPGCLAGEPHLASTSATRMHGPRGPEHSPRLLAVHGTTVRIGVRTPTDSNTYFLHIEIVVAPPGSAPSAPLEYADDPYPHRGFADPIPGQQVIMQFKAPRPGRYPVLVATTYATSPDCQSPQPATTTATGGSGEQVAELIVR